MPRLLAFAAVPLSVLAFLASGCGGGGSSDDTSPTEEWAGNVCTALSSWASALTEAANSLRGGNLSADALGTAADDAKEATETLVDDLRGLGQPDTEAGAEAQEALNGLADDLESDLEEIESAVDDPSSIASAAVAVTSTLSTMTSQLASTFAELQQLDAEGDLVGAFEAAESCDELTG